MNLDKEIASLRAQIENLRNAKRMCADCREPRGRRLRCKWCDYLLCQTCYQEHRQANREIVTCMARMDALKERE